MSTLLTDRAALERHRQSLLADREKKRSLDPEELEALAECSFRLALLPNAPTDDSLKLLRQAMRIDGGHPRYAYHVARLLVARGDLARAGEWLLLAQKLARGSHRIWTHISLLQSELNANYRGDDRYEPDSLRRRSQKLAGEVQKGSDAISDPRLLELTPEVSLAKREAEDRRRKTPSAIAWEEQVATAKASGESEEPVAPLHPRISRLGRRWSGAADLLAEAHLEAQATPGNRDKIQPFLAEVAALSAKRQGGPGAFAILSIEWLLRGYSPKTVRMLVAGLGADGSPAMALLKLVLEIMEMPSDSVPKRLALALADRALPPFLAGLLHQRRMLGHPLRFRTLAPLCRSARQFSASAKETDTADAERLATALRDAFRDMEAAPVPSVPAKAETATGPAGPDSEQDQPQAVIDQLAQEATELQDGLKAAWPRLKQFQIQASSADGLSAADCAEAESIARLVERAERIAQKGTERIGALKASGCLSNNAATADPQQAEEVQKRLESVEKALQALAGQPGRYRTVLAKLNLPAATSNSGNSNASVPCPNAPNEVSAESKAPAGIALRGARLTEGDRRMDDLFGNVLDTYQDQPQAVIDQLAQEATEIQDALKAAWPRLKQFQIQASSADGLSAVGCAEAESIARLVERAERTARKGTERIGALKASGCLSNNATAADPQQAGELQKRLESVEKALQALAGQPGRYRTALAKLKLPAATSNPESSDASVPCANAPDKIAAESEALTGIALLRATLAEADRRMDDLFDNILATFVAYTDGAQDLPAIKTLRLSVCSRQAEAYYRVGRRAEARRAWAGILRDDPLDLAAARNIAVCDTNGPDRGRELPSWRAYAELLYFCDIVEGAPNRRALLRAELHRELSHAYAPAGLVRDPLKKEEEDEKVDPLALAEFLNSPQRVRLFVSHKLLEFFNRTLAFTSPSLLLGVFRDASEAARRSARSGTLEFIESTAPLLPPRVREAFRGVAKRRIEEALEACQSTHALTLRTDPDYEPQKKQLQALVTEAVGLRVRLFAAITNATDLSFHLTSPQFVAELLRLRALPYSRSPEILQAVASCFGSGDPDRVLETVDQIRDWALSVFHERELRVAAETILRDAVAEDDRNPDLVRMMIGYFVQTATKARRTDGHESLVSTVNGWLARAERTLQTDQETGVPLGKKAITAEALGDIRQELDHALCSVFLAAGGVPPDSLNDAAPEDVCRALDAMIMVYPESVTARWTRHNMRYQQASNAIKKGARDQAIKLMKLVREDAEVVVRVAKDEELQKNAVANLAAIDEALAQAGEAT